MDVLIFIEQLKKVSGDFFTGVPDSLLKPLCNYLMDHYSISNKHIIVANEGNAAAIAAGYHMATGKVPCVYLQNSGLGNLINPVTSLLNNKVYGIPCVFIIGWRGEPGVPDEPQHIFQGENTLDILKTVDIDYMIFDKNTTESKVEEKMAEFQYLLKAGKSVAFVMKKDALSYNKKVVYENKYATSREEIIHIITDAAKEDIVVSTTGKTSRELFEIREQKGQPHNHDFLTVGSMGHSSSIALGIALNKPRTRVWCIDGDGSALMHLGSMAVIGGQSPNNFIHIVINNEAHESVGGQPTVAKSINFKQIALGCGYNEAHCAETINDFKNVLSEVEEKKGPIFIEIKSAIGSRGNLGRPTKTPTENKQAFMKFLAECNA
ncbi:phosphonopyruvate decarboxylase [Domibacillus robiginosus]|uniref:phosphonopyruvate decarboxylase n=1 Tax=Domibacillus robiginosus TaxID=1071054 RepID=UPI00067B5EB7|nr:phosphonopyruvate decarboxylase [Domibacillus robiginosus]